MSTLRETAIETIHNVARGLANPAHREALTGAAIALSGADDMPADPRERAAVAIADAEALGRDAKTPWPVLQAAWMRAQTYAWMATAPVPLALTTHRWCGQFEQLDDVVGARAGLDPDDMIAPPLIAEEAVEPHVTAAPPRRARATGPGRAVKDNPQA